MTADTNTKVDVYVRDMETPIGVPAAYELISARDGGDIPASYGFPTNPLGVEITPGSAISADGSKVVFRTRAASDLPTPAAPPAPPVSVPLGQLFVRDRAAKTTTLITKNMDDGSPAGGVGAADVAGISSDGSTVVWAGTNAVAQTPFLIGEQVMDLYYLWRRIADGPSAPTRRITGIVDLDDPACPPGSEIRGEDPNALGPCYGPLAYPEGIPTAGLPTGKLPALSADGTRVAFLVSPYPRPTNLSGNQLDVYVTDMRAGVSRKAGTTELTQETLQEGGATVQVVSISGDGRRIAFVTERTIFALPSPRLVSPPPVRSSRFEDLYVIDLATMEIERAAVAYNGSPIDGRVIGDTGSVALSHDGSRIAFLSQASNLFFGDANTAVDAFALSEVDPNADAGRATAEPPFAEIGPPREGSGPLHAPVGAEGEAQGQLAARHREGSRARPGRGPGAGPAPPGQEDDDPRQWPCARHQSGIEDLHRAARKPLSRCAAPSGRDPHTPRGHLHADRRWNGHHGPPVRVTARLTVSLVNNW